MFDQHAIVVGTRSMMAYFPCRSASINKVSFHSLTLYFT
jgi:hypothetical protein